MNLTLYDGNETKIGTILIEQDLRTIRALFHPSLAYQMYARHFSDLEYAANNQLFLETDRLQRKIENWGFYVVDHRDGLRKEITDLQIMETGLSFRWKPVQHRP